MPIDWSCLQLGESSSVLQWLGASAETQLSKLLTVGAHCAMLTTALPSPNSGDLVEDVAE